MKTKELISKFEEEFNDYGFTERIYLCDIDLEIANDLFYYIMDWTSCCVDKEFKDLLIYTTDKKFNYYAKENLISEDYNFLDHVYASVQDMITTELHRHEVDLGMMLMAKQLELNGYNHLSRKDLFILNHVEDYSDIRDLLKAVELIMSE